jgi:hypothetical protein
VLIIIILNVGFHYKNILRDQNEKLIFVLKKIFLLIFEKKNKFLNQVFDDGDLTSAIF